ncbi:MAG: MMPL family transporter [Alphaproteobacteria bacterium]|nr:MMPL family transporter [Alphaproteobacteria bacterium]
MLKATVVRLVDFCTWRAIPVIILFAALTGVSALYAAQHFAIATDTKALFPRNLPWTARAYKYLDAFPDRGMVAVVDAPTPEAADAATRALSAALTSDHAHFKTVDATQTSPFFAHNGMLFLPKEKIEQIAGNMGQSAPLIGSLAADPSLRGALGALSYGVMGVVNGAYPLDSLQQPMNTVSDTLDKILAGQPAHFSWQELASGQPAAPEQLRHFVQIEPVLDFNELQPGKAATDALYAAVKQLDLAGQYQARVRVTGVVPMNDAQFGTLTDHAVLNAVASLAAVGIILWLALRTWQIIAAAAISVVAGLAISAAAGLFLVGTLNLISVAFFVLFVGLGIDFGIQYCVRYRAERHDLGELRPALISAAGKAGGPLALAAGATALGFAAFLPTEYRGLSELGEIAGLGMLVAFLTSITLLPALLSVLNPPAEQRPMGFTALAPVDNFLSRHRIGVVVTTLGVVAVAAPLLFWLPFDFNPLHLQNPKDPAVATYEDLRTDLQTGATAVEILSPSLPDGDAVAHKLAALPQVSQTRTLSTLIPADQDAKLALLKPVANKLLPALSPETTQPAPSDTENVQALVSTAGGLAQVAAMAPGAGADAANRLSGLLMKLATSEPAARERAAAVFVEPLRLSLASLRDALTPERVTLASLPVELKQGWMTPRGEARVEVLPKGDPDDTAVLRGFVTAVLKIEPNATGPAVLIYEAGNTIVHAFVEAGAVALVSIFLLLWVTLRRLTDVLMTLLPLMLAAVLTLELCVVLHMPLNFANIIALPLLFGVGVAFKIYYIMAWRQGRTALVQSTLSRAVIFSAMTTGTAFGSLWLSSNPGTSSMGALMALALLCTMAAAVLFQPALMGPPRRADDMPQPPILPAARLIEAEPLPTFGVEPIPADMVWRVERRPQDRPHIGAHVVIPAQSPREKEPVLHEFDD